MVINNKKNDMYNYLFSSLFIIFIVLLLVILNSSETYRTVTENSNNLTDEYSKQMEAIQEKLKVNSDIADKKITFMLTSRVLHSEHFSGDFNYTGLMPETIKVEYTMEVKDAMIFLDNRYKQIKKDKNWYVTHDRLDEYNYNLAETVNVTRDICRELKKEYHLLADEPWL
ncbi:MAG: hypothetical protein ABRQ38_29920 [Candidatus Eremiobacterota bacterium]